MPLLIPSSLTRRSLLGRGAIGTALMAVPLISFPGLAFAAAPTDRRFLFIIQRGAADGLSILAPTGDPAFAATRGALAGDFADAPRIDSLFALHPALAEVGRLHAAKQALFVHAVASPYRDRSHFDGQNVLETGGSQPYQRKDGWLNRLIGLLPPQEARAVAVAVTVPPALRGSQPVGSYAASALPAPTAGLLERVGDMYEADSQLHALWAEAMQTRAMAGDQAGKQDAAATGKLAASLMSGPGGARIGMIETGGWDTHTAQSARLGAQLKGLDAMIAAFREGLGADWDKTVVLVATEFGRTAAVNGTGGTDHGTASVAMLLGGAVRGGRVVADWPGLAPGQLFEGRDLRPTHAMDGLIAGTLADHFRIDPARTATTLFPGGPIVPTANLIA
jgi:uncharacterized protein (DUF1501 family)